MIRSPYLPQPTPSPIWTIDRVADAFAFIGVILIGGMAAFGFVTF